jgi:hypothetical protein
MNRTVIAVATVLGLAAVSYAIGHSVGSNGSFPRWFASSSSSDVESPLIAALTLPDPAERSMRLVQFFAKRGPGDLDEIREALRKARYDVDPTAFALFADWWVSFDPRAALVASTSWPLEDIHAGITSVVRAWARRDPAAARAAVERIAGEERLQRCTEALVIGWQDSGAEGLVAYIEALPSGILQQRALEAFLARMATRDGIEAVLQFAEARPDDDKSLFKLQVFRRAVTAVAAYDPMRAAQWAERQEDGPYGDGLLRRVGAAWAFQDPETAMNWAAALGDHLGRDEAVRETYRVFLGRDRARALAWAKAQPPTARLQPALPLIAVALTRDDPQEGLAWLAKIEDADLRQAASVSLVEMWMRSDVQAARAWLEAAPLPDAVKESIRHRNAAIARRGTGSGRSDPPAAQPANSEAPIQPVSEPQARAPIPPR